MTIQENLFKHKEAESEMTGYTHTSSTSTDVREQTGWLWGQKKEVGMGHSQAGSGRAGFSKW